MQANRTPVPMAVSSPSGGLHLLRSTVQLVRVIMENTGPGDLVIWVADEDQLSDWARRALERLLGSVDISRYSAFPCHCE